MEFRHLNAILDKYHKNAIPFTELIVFHNGEQVFRGYRSQDGEYPEKELYNLYSCSKFITAVAALKLLEEGKFALDDDVADYIPAFADITVLKGGRAVKADENMKIRHLFTMTAGFNYNHNAEAILRGKTDTGGACPTLKMADYLAQIPLDFEPGELYRYSLCHDVLPPLVEVITGERFGNYVKRTIFEPLGMNDTTYNLYDRRLDEICPQYHERQGGVLEDIGPSILYYKFGTEYESGGAGCVGTAMDQMRFLEGLRTGKVLSFDTIELMSMPALNEKQLAVASMHMGYNYGLGVRVPEKGS